MFFPGKASGYICKTCRCRTGSPQNQKHHCKQSTNYKDNKINIYDLSAVVSYFGETGNVENGYAQYDLNRDTKIDSKDVAYVLVSWGK